MSIEEVFEERQRQRIETAAADAIPIDLHSFLFFRVFSSILFFSILIRVRLSAENNPVRVSCHVLKNPNLEPEPNEPNEPDELKDQFKRKERTRIPPTSTALLQHFHEAAA